MKNDTLKLIGIVTMTIDHIGWLFFPQVKILRIIGRISFPIFAYQIALGYKKTSNVYKYMVRLLFFALISQVPYGLITDGLNIMFTLLVGLIMIHLYQTSIILSLLPLCLTYFFNMDYGLYGLLTIYGFYVFRDIKPFFILLNVIFYRPIQAFSVMALPLISFEFKKKITLNKYFFYWYYPLHLMIFYLIKEFCL